MTVVKFIKHSGPYSIGDSAAFDEIRASALVNKGVAEIVQKEQPQPATKAIKKTVPTNIAEK